MRRKTEIRLKQWVAEEAAREGLTLAAIYGRVSRGDYPDILAHKVNSRVVVLQIEGDAPQYIKAPRKGEVPITKWFDGESVRLGITRGAMITRYYRHRDRWPVLTRRVNARVVFVRVNESAAPAS